MVKKKKRSLEEYVLNRTHHGSTALSLLYASSMYVLFLL